MFNNRFRGAARGGRVVVLLLLLVSFQRGDAHQPEPAQPDAKPLRQTYPEQYHPDLKNQTKDIADLFPYGLDAPTCLKYEPGGLRLNLPAGYLKQRPGTGVITDFGVKGDFELTVTYEGMRNDKPGGFAELRLIVVPNERPEPEVWHKANQNRASLKRQVFGAANTGQFVGSWAAWDPNLPRDKWGNEDFSRAETSKSPFKGPSKSAAGRLRLVRNGTSLYYEVSDNDQEFIRLGQYDQFGTKDLKNVRLLGSTGGPNSALDVLITDLHIRAEGFVKQGGALPAPPPVAGNRFPIVPAVIAFAVGFVVVLVLGLGAWLVFRSRTAPMKAGPAPGATVFVCPSCRKKIKASAQKAGKAVKCSNCGKAVKMPTRTPEDAEEVS